MFSGSPQTYSGAPTSTNKALNELPFGVGWAANKALKGRPSDVSWALQKALNELPSVVSWLSRKALNELPFGLLVQLQQVRATHARRPNPLSATRCDGPASLGG